MKRPNPKEQKYYAGHIFLDQLFLNDVDIYVFSIEQENKELTKDNKYVYQALNDRRKICDKLEFQNKELIEEITDLKAQLNDDGEIPFVDIPIEKTRYKLTEIKKK